MKILKFLLIAIVVIGFVIGLCLMDFSEDGGGVDPNQPRYKYWEAKIESLCQKNKWTVDGYEGIAFGIKDDKGVTNDEKSVLAKLLYAKSCSNLSEVIHEFLINPCGMESEKDDELKNGYLDVEWTALKEAFALLEKAQTEFGENGKLADARKLLKGYNDVWSMLHPHTLAKYGAFEYKHWACNTADRLQQAIDANQYWQTYFVKNEVWKAKYANLSKAFAASKTIYYKKLEAKIEEHYDLIAEADRRLQEHQNGLREDHETFDRFAQDVNADACRALDAYVRRFRAFGLGTNDSAPSSAADTGANGNSSVGSNNNRRHGNLGTN